MYIYLCIYIGIYIHIYTRAQENLDLAAKEQEGVGVDRRRVPHIHLCVQGQGFRLYTYTLRRTHDATGFCFANRPSI